MSRLFDGVDDQMTYNPGPGLAENHAKTLLAVVKNVSGTSWADIITLEDSSGGNMGGMGRRSNGRLYWSDSSTIQDFGATTAITATTTWWVLAVTVSASGTTVRGHKVNVGGGSPVHVAGSAAVNAAFTAARLQLGLSADPFNGKFAAAAVFDKVLTDAEIEGIATAATTQSIADLTPVALYDDSDAFATNLINPGTYDRSAIVQTADDAEDPPSWVYGLSGGGGQTLDVGKVATGAAVHGADVTQAGPDTLTVGKVATGEAVHGANVTQAGPATLDVGKVASGEAVHGVTLAGASQTLDVGKVTSPEAVHGADVTQSGPVTLALGKVTSSAATHGADVTQAGPVTLDVAKAATERLSGPLPYNFTTGPAVWGVGLSQSGSGQTLGLGKVTSSEAAHGVDLSQSGPVTQDVGKVTSTPTVRGVTLSQSGPVTLDLGKVPSGEAVHGADVSQVGAGNFGVGKVTSSATVRGVTLSQSGPVTQDVGKVTSSPTVRGVTLSQSGPVTLDLGKVTSTPTVRGATLSQSGPATLAVGKVASATVVRGVNFTQGVPLLVHLALSASVLYELDLTARAPGIELAAFIPD